MLDLAPAGRYTGDTMAETKPNVLFIAIDDLRPQLACYGREQMRTPHMDGLAERGVLFRQAYCQVPVCGATRASLLTGVRPARDRFVHYFTWADEDLPGALTLPEHFRNEGYVTRSLGKVFHHRTDCAERSWCGEPWRPEVPGSWRNYQDPENRRLDESPDHRGPAWECMDVPDDAYFDGQVANRACEEMDQLTGEDEPWFLAVGFVKPHLPFNAPKTYWNWYGESEVNLADNPWAPEGAPDEALHNWGELRQYFDIPPEGPVSEETAYKLVHGYYAATSYTDALVGQVLQQLDALGQRNNTIVILWGDHGWQLGEHGLWCKHCNFETSLNAPLMISAPDLQSGASTDQLVEFVDVYPTLCELAGIPIPDHCQGASLSPVLHSPDRPLKSAVFSRYHAGDSIRTGDYLYTEWTDDDGNQTARMLYDHAADPEENVNLSEKPEHAELVAELSRQLREGWQAVRPG
jgi:arylsulfatase A-like enzyme